MSMRGARHENEQKNPKREWSEGKYAGSHKIEQDTGTLDITHGSGAQIVFPFAEILIVQSTPLSSNSTKL